MAKKNPYEIIAQDIISNLEEVNTKDFVMPWHKTGASWYQTNIVSKKPYRGGNAFITFVIASQNGWQSSVWGTYKQMKEAGHQIAKGEKGTAILKFNKTERKDKVTGEIKEGAYASYCKIFNLAQTKDYEPVVIDNSDPFIDVEEIEKFVKATGASIKHGQDMACFYSESRSNPYAK